MPAKPCCGVDYDALFDDRMARRDLDDYRRKGVTGQTRRLVESIRSAGVEGATLLDIGGGIGAIQLELLAAGASHATDVDASRAFIATARDEAERRGFAERTTYHYGDFVALADAIPAADVVTLDRVVCCYADMPALVEASIAHARRLYGLVYPVDRWWIRAGAAVGNLGLRIFRQSFRFHVHRTADVDRLVRAAGFERQLADRGLLWQVALYRRTA
ncbi:MAG TPA: class I SAM-dependent methyltransferase [Candidatus Limnocylindria bacterium]|nr:class I SAM-dependent methyltransferase [Candidatus Limnocylindria bacterium]